MSECRTKIKYSETFFSPQGEGKYTGTPSVWLRFAHCNLQCHGFGQEDPTDPDTYILDFKDYDPAANGVTVVEDLPVWERGCDSSYTWAKKYDHLMHKKSAAEVCDILEDHMKNEFNPEGKFLNPHSNMDTHLCMTGGEPFFSQKGFIAVMDEFVARGNVPLHITVETNTTNKLTDDFIAGMRRWEAAGVQEFFFSCSPKLWTVAGEKPEKAIKPEVMKQYFDVFDNQLSPFKVHASIGYSTSPDYVKPNIMKISGQIKIVANGSEATWKEFESAVQAFRDEGIDWEVYAMPVGATLEEQEITAADVALQANARGYKVAPRVHVYLFGNQIGT